jgi:hypothetical protein
MSADEGDIADLVAGSAAKVAVVARNVSAVAKSTRFIDFIFLWFDDAVLSMHALRLSRSVPAAIFSGGMPPDQVSGVRFRSFAAEMNVASGTESALFC